MAEDMQAGQTPASPAQVSAPGTPGVATGKPPKAPKVKKPKKPKKPSVIKSWFTDKNKRARLIIWAGVVALGGIGFVAVALGVTSSYWFCANGCHMVQDDTIIAYNRSSHNKISCMACHMPVNADPVTFMIHKVKALGELYTTVTDAYELPLNAESEVAKEMPSDQCTQCHSNNREFTYSNGIVMDHEIHAAKGVNCTLCHNRVAHKEDFSLTLAANADPKQQNKKHENWMSMEACFRCHNLDPTKKGLEGLNAPGKCSVCHPTDFDLKPVNHSIASFETSGHPALAEEKGLEYCYMCHDQKTFCNACHGMPMPHSEEFKTKTHGAVSQEKGKLAKCEMCHEQTKTKFCDKCHHGTKSNWTYDTKQSWVVQHPDAIAKAGSTKACMTCHNANFCADCHTKNKVIPSDHLKRTWTNPPTPKLGHPAAYKKSPTSCEVCHGTGGSNAKFCKSCHKIEIPHPGDFKTSHGPMVKKNNPPKAVCLNCHVQQFCDGCHHKGSSPRVSWLVQHPVIVKKNGPTECFQCHQETFCSGCHVHLVNGTVPGR